MPPDDDVTEHLLHLVARMNNWSLERVWDLREELRRVGLMGLHAVAHPSEDEVAARLTAAGHTRGEFMNTMMPFGSCRWAKCSRQMRALT